jgi:hypothetical protein
VAILRYILDLLADALPDISNLLLGVLGVLMSLPKLAEKIEENPRLRYSLGIFCILLGFGGFALSIKQRHQSESEMRRLVSASFVQATKDDIEDLGGKVDAGFDRVVAAVNALAKTKHGEPVEPSGLHELVPVPLPEHIRYVERRIPSPDPAAQYGLQVIIQTDANIQPLSLAVVCTGPIEKADNFIVGVRARMAYSVGLSEDRKIYFMSYQLPPFTPQTPIVVTLLSKSPINVQEIKLNSQE